MIGSVSRFPGARGLRAAAGLLAGLALTAAGCTSTARLAAPPAERGVYAGSDAAGTAVRLELTALGDARAGHGEIAGRPLAVAALGAGAAVLADGSGPAAGRLTLAGETVTLEAAALDGAVRLARTGDAVPAGGGRFAGRFRDRGADLELELLQWGERIAGRGSLAGRPVVLAAVAGGSGAARGGLLLAGGSAIEITLAATAGGRLTLGGLAGERELGRVE